jgi:hypothetical protein
VTKISLWVGADDWAWLQTLHRYDASRVVRDLIGNYRRKIEAPRTARDDLEALDLDRLSYATEVPIL